MTAKVDMVLECAFKPGELLLVGPATLVIFKRRVISNFAKRFARGVITAQVNAASSVEQDLIIKAPSYA
jgi:hypothetical protein